MLGWFEHVEVMDEYRVAGGVLMAKVSGPRLGWMNVVIVAFSSR